MRKKNYLNNKDILKEIHKSKTTYCKYASPEDVDFDMILPNVSKINKTNVKEALKLRAERLAKLALDSAQEADPKTKYKLDEFKIKPSSIPVTDLVFRVMTFEHIPPKDIKFMGEAQTKYAKKNWSSVMMFNNIKCRTLTPEYANSATGLELHQFKWLESDNLIGEIPPKWNILVDYNHPNDEIGLLHYTDGGPFYPATQDCSFNKEWFQEFEQANYCQEANIYNLTKIALKQKEAA